jgi:DNA polymerase-3 subunit delta'
MWKTIGHTWAVDLLSRQLERGSLHHAYLISGPSGVGRQGLALDFAAALLCEDPTEAGAACGVCRACRQVSERAYPDLHVVEREEGKQGIAIEQIRELQRHLVLTPLGGRRRVALVLDIDQASLGAANALLKTLEEPPPRVVLLLTAIDVERVPPTISSRCESVALRPVPAQEIARALEARGVEKGKAEKAANRAAGRPAWAIRSLDDAAYRERLDEYADSLRAVMGMDLAGRFGMAEEWKDDEALEERLSLWLSLAAEAMRTSLGPAPASGAAAIPGLADLVSSKRAVDSILRTLDGIRHNVNTRLAVETMMLDLPRGAGRAGYEAAPAEPGSG